MEVVCVVCGVCVVCVSDPCLFEQELQSGTGTGLNCRVDFLPPKKVYLSLLVEFDLEVLAKAGGVIISKHTL